MNVFIELNGATSFHVTHLKYYLQVFLEILQKHVLPWFFPVSGLNGFAFRGHPKCCVSGFLCPHAGSLGLAQLLCTPLTPYLLPPDLSSWDLLFGGGQPHLIPGVLPPVGC